MKHYGDITKIDGAKVEPVWIICGGSPCQDLSVAGLRKGLQHSALGDEETTRSGLFMEQVRIAKEMRENDKRNGRTGKYVRCRWMWWENVPGALSSNHGEDFRCVIEEIAKIIDENAVIPGPPKGKWSPAGLIIFDNGSIGWRIHDGQFWGRTVIDSTGKVVKAGTPQRRRRISLVADFADRWGAGKILFEPKGMSGDLEQSREERQAITTDVAGGTYPSSYTLKVRGGERNRQQWP